MTVKNTVVCLDGLVFKVKRCKNARQSRYIITECADSTFVNKILTQWRVAGPDGRSQYEAVMTQGTQQKVVGYFLQS